MKRKTKIPPHRGIILGKWAQSNAESIQEDMPWPGDWIDWDFDETLRNKIVEYLSRDKFLVNTNKDHQLNNEQCLLCRANLPSGMCTNGIYHWRVSYAHYVHEHGVVPPKEMIRIVQRQVKICITIPRELLTDIKRLAKNQGTNYKTIAEELLASAVLRDTIK